MPTERANNQMVWHPLFQGVNNGVAGSFREVVGSHAESLLRFVSLCEVSNVGNILRVGPHRNVAAAEAELAEFVLQRLAVHS